MAGFAMCAACRRKHDDPADRRFHAQPIACPDCGPTLELVAPGLRETGDHAVRRAQSLLADGQIAAVKGLGGYHVACDARDVSAVSELRRPKRRGEKPFAVMARDLDVARELVSITDIETMLLTDVRKPVVLLPRLDGSVAAAVAPGNPDLGVMLPYTPQHALLLGAPGDPGPDLLVMTSGNLAGEPIVTDDDEALSRLGDIADAFLRHDRPIQVSCDDSVTRVVAGIELPVRRSRGYAPLPVALPFDVAPVLAAGADLKNTVAVASGRFAWLSQHVGDLDDLATQDALTVSEQHLEELTGVRPGVIVADAHPGYRSTPGPDSTPTDASSAACSTITCTSPRSWASTGSVSTSRSSGSPREMLDPAAVDGRGTLTMHAAVGASVAAGVRLPALRCTVLAVER